MNRYFLSCLLLSIVSCNAALAVESGVNIAEGAYVRTNHDASGFLLRGAVGLGKALVVDGSYEQTSYFGHHLYQASLGAGMRWPLNDSLQMFAGVSGEVVHSPTGGDLYEDEFTFTGVGIKAGVRGRVAERLELSASIKYDNINDKILPSAGARYYFTRRLAAGLDFSDEFFGTRVMSVLRFDFGTD
jgi:hypothetical protein